jgi:hypothetical protein
VPFWQSSRGAATSAGFFLGVLWHCLGDSIAYWCGYTELFVGLSNVLMCALAAQRFETLGIRLFAKAAWAPSKRKAANFGVLFAFCAVIIVLYIALEGAVDAKSGEDVWRSSNLAVLLPALAVSLAFTALAHKWLTATLPTQGVGVPVPAIAASTGDPGGGGRSVVAGSVQPAAQREAAV